MSFSSSFLLKLSHILDRYFECPHPKLSDYLSLHLVPTKPQSLKKSLAAKKTLPEAPKALPAPVALQIPSPKKLRSVSWECVPLHPDLSREDILKEHYPSLKNNQLVQPQHPPCAIFVDEEQDEEVLFFNRLAKILTQQLFPTRLSLLTSQTNIFSNSKSLVLGLAPLNVIRYKIPCAQYHKSFTQNGCTFIPLYSCLQYEKDTQLKRDLWAILNQQPFAYTQKSL